MKIYLAGPMSGIKEYNYPAFAKAAKKLRVAGHWVLNPAELNPPVKEYRLCLAVDLAWICSHAEAIALLPGWENSKGSAVEFALAKALGLKFIYL
jgi:hypothetical protein